MHRDRHRDPEDGEVAVGRIGKPKRDHQSDQTAEGNDAAKGAAQSQTEHAADCQDAKADQSHFGAVELGGFRLVFLGKDGAKAWVQPAATQGVEQVQGGEHGTGNKRSAEEIKR